MSKGNSGKSKVPRSSETKENGDYIPDSDGPNSAALDLFLSEDALVQLAMKELKGRLPPGFFSDGRDEFLAESTEEFTGDSQGAHQGRPLNPKVGKKSGPFINANYVGNKTVLAHELEMRGWTPRDLARSAGILQSEAVALAKGNTKMTREIAEKLSKVFATSIDFWM
jgi:hypothetical protein